MVGSLDPVEPLHPALDLDQRRHRVAFATERHQKGRLAALRLAARHAAAKLLVQCERFLRLAIRRLGFELAARVYPEIADLTE